MVVGLDFGHDHVALAETDGRVLAEQASALDVDHQARATLDTASMTTLRLLSSLGLNFGDVRGVAAGIPAPLDLETNQIRTVQIMPGWGGLHPADELSRLFGRTVTMNDAELGAHGEMRFGAARGLRDFVYVKASEGIGASLVLGGKVYRGARGLSGEIGHTRVQDQSLLCRCGRSGCLETVVSSAVVLDRMRDAGIQPADEMFPSPTSSPPRPWRPW